jgi:Mrp family chromosome partitioning ATPase
MNHLANGIGGPLGSESGSDSRLHNEEVMIGALRLLWYSRGTFVIAAILAMAMAAVLVRFGPRTYLAESVIRFDFTAASTAASTPRLALDPAAVVDSEARIARSRTVAEQVVARLHLADDSAFASPPGHLTQLIDFLGRRPEDGMAQPDDGADTSRRDLAIARVMATTVVDHDNKSYLIGIRFRWSDPQTAARLANALAQEYLRQRQTQSLIATKARLSAELTQISMRLGDKFPTYLAVKAQLDEIGRSLDDANLPATPVRSVALGDFTAEIAVPAHASPVQASPNPKSVYAMALLGGFILTAAFLLLRQRWDTRLTNEWAVADRLGMRCFGTIPDGTSWRASARAALREAARSVAVASGLDVKGQSCRVVVLTSSLPDEGKTLLATALAAVLAEHGQRVLLVDAVPRAHPKRLGHRALTGAEGFAENMLDARKSHDVVIIKAPPILMLSDAAHLARNADLLMLLVRWRRTPARIAAEALRRLQEAGAPVSGTVLTNVPLHRQLNATIHDQSYYLARYGKFYASISS